MDEHKEENNCSTQSLGVSFTAQKTAGDFPFSKAVLFGMIGNYSRQWLFKLFPH